MKNKLIILITLIVVVSCRKDDEIPYCEEFPNDCVDVREVKDYFYFNYGSWWVYEEENSGKRDSVYVTETSNDPTSVLFETWLYSSYDEYSYIYFTKGVRPEVKNNIAKKSVKSTTVYCAKGKPGDYIGEGECFLFYPIPNLWSYSYGGVGITNNKVRIDSVFSSYSVLEENYYDVVSVFEEHTIVEESQPTMHYYSPNIGLIKKELLDSNQIWNLVDYHIVK